ncbi:MAG TPA: hypothetical protein VFC78_11030, partial [Tepidisphaeraceae bacterium]|nr:hypothetical protein [Tepidisphaeraceae bacterium]
MNTSNDNTAFDAATIDGFYRRKRKELLQLQGVTFSREPTPVTLPDGTKRILMTAVHDNESELASFLGPIDDYEEQQEDTSETPAEPQAAVEPIALVDTVIDEFYQRKSDELLQRPDIVIAEEEYTLSMPDGSSRWIMSAVRGDCEEMLFTMIGPKVDGDKPAPRQESRAKPAVQADVKDDTGETPHLSSHFFQSSRPRAHDHQVKVIPSAPEGEPAGWAVGLAVLV